MQQQRQNSLQSARRQRAKQNGMFTRTLLLGFCLGACCTVTVQLLLRSHEDMGIHTQAVELAEQRSFGPDLHADIHHHASGGGDDDAQESSSTMAGNVQNRKGPDHAADAEIVRSSMTSTTTKSASTTSVTTEAAAAVAAAVKQHNSGNVTHPPANTPPQNNDTLLPFTKQEGVVIVTKIHSIYHWEAVKQSLCLLQRAYNYRPNYDILVFTTLPIPQEKIDEAQELVQPAKLIVALDNPGLPELVRSFTPDAQQHLLERCNVTSVEQLHWDIICHEPNKNGKMEKLAYNWQAEFRGLHLWHHKALLPYKRMMWIDTDTFCTQIWQKDPIVYAIQNDLAIFFLNFPMGRSSGDDFREKTRAAFGTTVCDINMADGHLTARLSEVCLHLVLRNIHGFFHITDLEFYRSESVRKWSRTLIGDTHFYRRYDDQVAVTVPAAVLAPNRSWHMADYGYNLEIFHNSKMDGKRFPGAGGFKVWWERFAATNFTSAEGKCPITIAT